MNTDIYHLKLATGDEIVGFIAGVTDDNITIEYPVMLERYKETGYQFSKWFPFSAEVKTHTISKLFVISCSDLEESVKQNYVMYALSIAKSEGHKDLPYPDQDIDDILDELEEDPTVH